MSFGQWVGIAAIITFTGLGVAVAMLRDWVADEETSARMSAVDVQIDREAAMRRHPAGKARPATKDPR